MKPVREFTQPWCGPAKCHSCGLPYTQHMGIDETCRRLGVTRAALRRLLDYAHARHGDELRRADIADTCAAALR